MYYRGGARGLPYPTPETPFGPNLTPMLRVAFELMAAVPQDIAIGGGIIPQAWHKNCRGVMAKAL